MSVVGHEIVEVVVTGTVVVVFEVIVDTEVFGQDVSEVMEGTNRVEVLNIVLVVTEVEVTVTIVVTVKREV